jgi:hypothetical protein
MSMVCGICCMYAAYRIVYAVQYMLYTVCCRVCVYLLPVRRSPNIAAGVRQVNTASDTSLLLKIRRRSIFRAVRLGYEKREEEEE